MTKATHDIVELEGGEFVMGSDRHYPEEAPAHRVRVDAFAIDRFEVTNARFEAFVEATGYETVAERPLDPEDFPDAPPANLVPGSMVFAPTPGPVDLRHLSQWWRWTPGAWWREPEGVGSTVRDRADHPVVHIAHEDALEYAAWVGGRLPTEAEWEFAARGGAEGAAFTWGDEPRPDGRIMANTWDGPDFPWRSTGASGFMRTSPVGSFPPNGFGLYDMAGNVWEWCSDLFRPDTYAREMMVHGPDGVSVNPTGPRASLDPRNPHTPESRVHRGGSYLCNDSYCASYRPSARMACSPDSGLSHLGFRCVVPAEKPADAPTNPQHE